AVAQCAEDVRAARRRRVGEVAARRAQVGRRSTRCGARQRSVARAVVARHRFAAGRCRDRTGTGAHRGRAQQRSRARSRHGDRDLALIDRLVDAAWDPLTTGLAEEPAGTALAECVGSTWRKFARSAASLRNDGATGDGATDEDWHKARIMAKQMRYACEAVMP